MQKNAFLILLLSVSFHFSNAQSSVAIGSSTPNPKAVLWLNAQGGQGLLLPSLSTSARTGMGLNNSTEKGMLVYDNQLDRIFFWNGVTWIEAVGGGGIEVDGIIGNEVTKVTTDRGLVLTGSGTAASPLSVGLMDGNADQQVLKWNNTTQKWELGTDVGAAFVAGTGIQISGTTLINSGDTDATNDITTASVAVGDVTGPFSNLQIAPSTVTATELANNAVTNLKIIDDAVTIAKIGTAGATDALKVMTTDASGNPQWTTPSGNMLKSTYDANANNIVDAAETINYPSQTANFALAAPNGSAGIPSFRSLVAADISSGVFPVTKGGTGISTVVPGAVAYGGPTNFAFTSAGTAGQLLQSNGTGAPDWVTTKYIGTTANGNITITSTANVQLLSIVVPESGTVDAHITANLTVEISGNGLGRYAFSIRRGSINGPQVGQTGWWRPGSATSLHAITIPVSGADNNAAGPLTYYLVGSKFDASAQDALVFLTGIEMHYTVK